MDISVHLRGGAPSDKRALGLVDGLERLGHRVTYLSRSTPTEGDLMVQVGFNASTALRSAIDKRIPYLIMEASPFRTMHPAETHSSWGYNGLAGGAFRHKAPDIDRAYPYPKPLKEGGKTLIIGQKPTDHSLRGSDHIRWLSAKLDEYPEAEFRHHPLMVPEGERGTIEDALREAGKVIVYTSTVAVDAAVAGCKVVVEGHGCWWNPEWDRTEQLRELAWASGKDEEYAGSLCDHVLAGYDEARSLAEDGNVEHPRGKLDGRAVCEQYYKQIVPERAAS